MNLDGIELVVFDATGTLITPCPSAESVYHQIGVRLGSDQSQDTTSKRFAESLKRHFGNASLNSGNASLNSGNDMSEGLLRPETSDSFERGRWLRIVRDTLPELTDHALDEAFSILWDYFSDPAAWQVYDDVEPALRGLAERGIRLAIGSNFDRRLSTVVQGIEPLGRIAQVFSSADLGFSKPDKRFFDAIVQSTPWRGEQLLMVGDDPLNDIEGAQAAGWNAVLVDRSAPGIPGRITSLCEMLTDSGY